MTTHRRTASEPGRTSARRACVQQRLSDAARVAWLLTALQAHQKGLARGTAVRMADRTAGVSTEARQAFAAFVDCVGADGPLPARLRRLVLARLAAALDPRQLRSAIRRAIAARNSSMPKPVRDDVASTSG
jgi:hypothetical protein